ncbi:MAG: hypothetical protein WA705_11055 [Candidatus Ozemobacteraceae bacterium]
MGLRKIPLRVSAAILVFTLFFIVSQANNLSAEPTLTLERAAAIAVDDARHYGNLSDDWRLFVGETTIQTGLLSIELLARPSTSQSPGQPYALYQIDSVRRSIVRRDFLWDHKRNAALYSLKCNLVDGMMGGIAIQGVLRNLPGYILGASDFSSRFTIWAEAGGFVVATNTQIIGTALYRLSGIPVTAGSVAIKAKIRGYDLKTLHPGVAINASQPAGVISGIDVDFHSLTPITRDVRLVIRTNASGTNSSFPNGARARVYAKETGQAVDVVSTNGWAEALLTNVPTGWPVSFLAINMDQGFYSGELGPISIPEDSGTAYSDSLMLK